MFRWYQFSCCYILKALTWYQKGGVHKLARDLRVFVIQAFLSKIGTLFWTPWKEVFLRCLIRTLVQELAVRSVTFRELLNDTSKTASFFYNFCEPFFVLVKDTFQRYLFGTFLWKKLILWVLKDDLFLT